MPKQENLLKNKIREAALEMGFNDIGFISAEPLLSSEKNFLKWREAGYAGDMDYLLRDNPKNARPKELFAEAKSIIVFSVNYYTVCPPRPSADHGRIAAYAVGKDYHKVIRKKIKQLLAKLQEDPELKNVFDKSRVFTDSVPLLEKSFAREAGLGFKGKNTLLISRENGSFNFIAEILTDIDFEPDEKRINKYQIKGQEINCGDCTRCIDICPTDALVNPHQIDARLCISYLNIENRKSIDEKLRPQIGEWLFGCDLCQIICPYNLKSQRGEGLETKWDEFKPASGFGHWIYLPEILGLDPITKQLKDHKIENDDEADQIFHDKFCQTPLTRPKRKGLIRNAMIVAANSKSPESKDLIQAYTKHEDQMLSETAYWAISQY